MKQHEEEEEVRDEFIPNDSLIAEPTEFQLAVLRVPERYNILLDGGRGSGKELALDTKIPTPDGWKTLAKMQVGDNVFDEQGVVCRVTAVHDTLSRDPHRLFFSDGTFLDAGADHQWVTWDHAYVKSRLRHDKTPTKGLPKDWAACRTPVTTEKIIETLTHSKRGDLNHRIPTAGPLQLPEIALPVDPYLFGVWLGDGTTNDGYITTMDEEIVEVFRVQGHACKKLAARKEKSSLYSPSPEWRIALRGIGFLVAMGRPIAAEKYVPSEYLRASAGQRLALLQGLMDTDGFADAKKNQVEFSNTNEKLVNAVVELARSLGEKPISKKGIGRLYGKDCRPKWRVTWAPKFPCFRLTRKLQRLKHGESQQSRHMHRMIVHAEPIPVQPMRCLEVDSPNHMYLAGEGMIPTHNSVASQFMMIRHAEKYRDKCKILYVRESWESIKQFEDELNALIFKIFGKSVHHHVTNHTFTWPHGATIQISQLEDEKDYNKFQGKALCDETPIPTPEGWKTLKHIQIGDKVFDEKGIPCNVTDIYEVWPESAYRLTFKDGCTVDCCSEHQWATLTFADRRGCDRKAGGNFPEDWANRASVTTQDIVDTFRYKGKDFNHSVPLAAPLELPEMDLGIDPYLFGLWLGDGTSVRPDITTMDPEIVSAFEEQGFTLEPRKTNSGGKAKCYKIGPNIDAPTGPKTKFGQQLYSLGVLGKGRKHIPSKFLRASREQRLALLQGLMDTDGYANCRCSSVEFSNSNPLIVKSFVELARSLGEKPVITHGIGECNGKKTKPKFRVRWTPNSPCFRLSRKVARLRLNPRGPGQRTITAYEKIAPKPMRCLMVDSPNHMYLCGEGMIPTHNSFTMLVVDEYGARREAKYVWLLVSNMRAPRGVATQVILLANPGGQQHGHIHYDFIAKAPGWEPFEKDGEPWVHCPSTWRDNPMIDQESYLRKLRQACGSDEELFKAWDTGDWNIARGAYFAGALDEKVHMLAVPQSESDPRIISPECPFPITSMWLPALGMDWGSGAPSVVYIGAESPGVQGFPKGSIILVDELAVHEPNDLNVGLNWPPDKLADAIKNDLCRPWRVFPQGVGDDAYGLQDTLLNTLRRQGVYFVRPRKERVAGWQEMRKMLVAAKERTGAPGLWISARCQYFWKTVPFLPRDPKRPEDIITKGVPDHGADSARYRILHKGNLARNGDLTGI